MEVGICRPFESMTVAGQWLSPRLSDNPETPGKGPTPLP